MVRNTKRNLESNRSGHAACVLSVNASSVAYSGPQPTFADAPRLGYDAIGKCRTPAVEECVGGRIRRAPALCIRKNTPIPALRSVEAAFLTKQ